MLEICAEAVPVFVSVICCEALLLTETFPKLTLVGFALS
jgi:hypothetical protein